MEGVKDRESQRHRVKRRRRQRESKRKRRQKEGKKVGEETFRWMINDVMKASPPPKMQDHA